MYTDFWISKCFQIDPKLFQILQNHQKMFSELALHDLRSSVGSKTLILYFQASLFALVQSTNPTQNEPEYE